MVRVYYWKTENNKKATNNVIGGPQAKSKGRMNYFEVKMTELHLVQIWFGWYIKKLALSSLRFTGPLTVWTNVLVINLQPSFTDVFRVLNATRQVRLSDLGVRKEAPNCCLPFKKNTIRSMYLPKSKVGID